jgi:hypothetical protein
MRDRWYPPKFGDKQFHCPLCHVFADQNWFDLVINLPGTRAGTRFKASYCAHCGNRSFWYEERLIVPTESSAEIAHPDLPEDCHPDYNEARDICARSPKGAAALLRLALQKLLVHLGGSGKSINDDIKSLVSKGLPGQVQQALDVCRVVGNNAVHPGELDIADTPEIAHQLFRMINFIVDDRITRPREIQALYQQLPGGARDAIAKRDETSQPGAPDRV